MEKFMQVTGKINDKKFNGFIAEGKADLMIEKGSIDNITSYSGPLTLNEINEIAEKIKNYAGHSNYKPIIRH